MATILVIDDDRKLCELLEEYLKRFGYRVLSARHPQDGLGILRRETIDLVILDIMLPDMDGFEVCRKIRVDSSIPIIMLTARGEVTDRIVGLEMGADDYLPKPFEPRELVARVQSILRRANADSNEKKVIRFKNLEINPYTQVVTCDGKAVDLGTVEFRVLEILAAKPGRIFDREELLDQLKGLEWQAENRSVDVAISRLRQKLRDDPKSPKWILTVRGRGYRFIGEEVS